MNPIYFQFSFPSNLSIQRLLVRFPPCLNYSQQMVDLGRNIRFTEGNEFSSKSYPDSSGSLASGWSPRVSQDPGDQPMTNVSERKRLKLQSSGPRVQVKTSKKAFRG